MSKEQKLNQNCSIIIKGSKMKRIILAPAAVLFVVLILTASSTAQVDKQKLRNRIHDKLNLTEEQEIQIQKLRSAHQKKMIELKAELEKAEVDAKDLRSKSGITREEVLNNIERINKIKNEIALASGNHRMDIYEILTPGQREIWQKFRVQKLDDSGRKGNRPFIKKQMRINRQRIW